MVKKALMLLLISSILLTACSNSKVMNFEGESDNWQVIYLVNSLEKNSESSKVTIKYIGIKPIPTRIKYDVETATGNSGGESPLKNGALITGASSCNGCAVTQKNEKITATISWNNKSDTLILNNH
jgi:hypothetical protein